jgi:anti-sigma regulatory factor (Ser/Thr protein kinase)
VHGRSGCRLTWVWRAGAGIEVMSSDASSKLWLKIPSDPANLAEVRRAVEKLCAQSGVDQRGCDEIGLCVNEAMANVIRHAYGGRIDRPIEVAVDATGAVVRIRIRDWGSGVVPTDLPPAAGDCEVLKPGGLGLICLTRMMGQVVFTPQPDGGMLLEMVRKKQIHA